MKRIIYSLYNNCFSFNLLCSTRASGTLRKTSKMWTLAKNKFHSKILNVNGLVIKYRGGGLEKSGGGPSLSCMKNGVGQEKSCNTLGWAMNSCAQIY